MKRVLYYITIVPALFVSAVMLWVLWAGRVDVPRHVVGPSQAFTPQQLQEARRHLLEEDPGLFSRIQQDSGFGGQSSLLVAADIFGASEAAVADVRAKTRVVPVEAGVWFIRFPIVNAVLVETQAGLVLIDTGYAAASPVLLETIRELSDKPLHTVIYTHGHVDHAYGLKELIAAGERPELIAHKNLPGRFYRYIKTRGHLAKHMFQPADSLPKSTEDFIFPSRVFEDRLELSVGGELFVLKHHRGETDDQLYVWMPHRGILASADYYQGFLPNAGNGLRVQRYPEEWAVALREMAALQPRHLLPGHGAAMLDASASIQNELNALAEALESIVQQTLDGLNRGLRRDVVASGVSLPPALRARRGLREVYVSTEDIARMAARSYTGWWDGVPSHWSPASWERQAQEISRLAGGAELLAERALALMTRTRDLRTASHVVDWAWLAEPGNSKVQEAVLKVYGARALHEDSNSVERGIYLDIMTQAKAYQLSRGR